MMKVFVTGATGYIGGSAAIALKAAGHQIVGLTRDAEKSDALRKLGFEPVIGGLDDVDLLRKQAHQADAVVHAANADHRVSAEALIAALKGSGKAFVHTSGSGIVADDANGELTDRVYEDDTPVTPLPQRAARLELIKDVLASARDNIRASVIAPPNIYGRGLGLNSNSLQVPMLIKYSEKVGAAKYVGKGANAWSNVHIADLADLYVLALTKAPAGAFYYAENGENTMREVAIAVANLLGFGGKAESMHLREAIDAFGETFGRLSFGSNSRVRAVRARKDLGWKPRQVALIDDIEHGSYAEDFGGRAV